MKLITPETLKSFIDAIDNNRAITKDGHWLWIGEKHPDGYGSFYDTNTKLQHRVTRLILTVVGKLNLTSSLFALHKPTCNIKNCFNPEHLYVGNTSNNTRDQVITGVHNNARKTHCSRGHEFTKENTYKAARGTRDCKTCQKINSAKFKANRREK